MRSLTTEELELICGGNNTDISTITIIAHPDDDGTSTWPGYTFSSSTTYQHGGGGGQDPDPEPVCTCGADTNGDGKSDFTNPNANGAIRGSDNYGSGAYGAPRFHAGDHNGVDYVVAQGDTIAAVVSGEVTKIGYAYQDNMDVRYVEITTSDGYVVREFYVDTTLTVGTQVNQGDSIGTYHSLQGLYPGITDHVHVEIKKDGNKVDPTTLIDSNKSNCAVHGG